MIKEFEEQFPSLKDEGEEYSVGSKYTDKLYTQEAIKLHCLDKQKVKKILHKHFVHGYEQGIHGAVHSSNCRLCKVLKELGLEDE